MHADRRISSMPCRENDTHESTVRSARIALILSWVSPLLRGCSMAGVMRN
jgi:hypothetical protein